MTKLMLAYSTTKLAVQQAANCFPLITADTPISRVAYKHALPMQPLKKVQQTAASTWRYGQYEKPDSTPKATSQRQHYC